MICFASLYVLKTYMAIFSGPSGFDQINVSSAELFQLTLSRQNQTQS